MWYPYSNGFLTVSSLCKPRNGYSCYESKADSMWGEHHWTVRFNFCRMLTYNFRVCVCVEFAYCRAQKKLQQFTSPVESCDLLPLCIKIRRTFVEKTSVPVPRKIGVGIIHIRPWLEVLGPLFRWKKKEYRNGGHWLPNKSELWSRPNTRSKWTNKFNTNEAIKVIKDGCKIQFLFHWMVQLSWLLLG